MRIQERTKRGLCPLGSWILTGVCRAGSSLSDHLVVMGWRWRGMASTWKPRSSRLCREDSLRGNLGAGVEGE